MKTLSENEILLLKTIEKHNNITFIQLLSVNRKFNYDTLFFRLNKLYEYDYISMSYTIDLEGGLYPSDEPIFVTPKGKAALEDYRCDRLNSLLVTLKALLIKWFGL